MDYKSAVGRGPAASKPLIQKGLMFATSQKGGGFKNIAAAATEASGPQA